MGQIKVTRTDIEGLYMIEPAVHGDNRGYFMETYNQQDMDIMNIACNGRILPLDPSFCMTVQLYYLMMNKPREFAALFPEEVTRRALRQGIVHYNGTKPWRKACLNMDIWWEYYRKSLWFDEEFCYRFWDDESLLLDRLTLSKRLKLLLRYPYDRKHVK